MACSSGNGTSVLQPVQSGRNIVGRTSEIINVRGLVLTVSEVKGIASIMENRFKQLLEPVQLKCRKWVSIETSELYYVAV